MTTATKSGQTELRSTVIDKGLCTTCGACVGICPYMKIHNAATVVMFDCDRDQGRCHRYCPRTPTQCQQLQMSLFPGSEITPELGPYRNLFMTRSADPAIRAKSQHGGTVSALLSLMLSEGVIQGAVVSGQDKNLLPYSYTAADLSGVLLARGSKFVNAPTLAEFNRSSLRGQGPLGVVATPCQAMALAKMRANPAEEDLARIGSLKMVLGLFCGWTLDHASLRALVERAAEGEDVLSLDIPPSKHACMEVGTAKRLIEVPIDQVNECVRECCDYCFDMTAEFADLSVGSARSEAGWELDKGWNQVIVRSAAGEALMNLAREKEVLEFREVPSGNLAKLKAASLKKKHKCLDNLTRIAGEADGHHYLDPQGTGALPQKSSNRQ